TARHLADEGGARTDAAEAIAPPHAAEAVAAVRARRPTVDIGLGAVLHGVVARRLLTKTRLADAAVTVGFAVFAGLVRRAGIAASPPGAPLGPPLVFGPGGQGGGLGRLSPAPPPQANGNLSGGLPPPHTSGKSRRRNRRPIRRRSSPR